ncbi:nipped-B-like protein B [Forsythia ovata]|uniref:Nipped-B-like protein B n=1 Tax=Forsythia ovata TaxID=205694 RepID=A0ABD1Q0V0_9LAMI
MTVQNLESFREDLCQFPPKTVQLKNPFTIQPKIDSEEMLRTSSWFGDATSFLLMYLCFGLVPLMNLPNHSMTTIQSRLCLVPLPKTLPVYNFCNSGISNRFSGIEQQSRQHNRIAQEAILLKDEQSRKAQSWMARAQEMDDLQSTANHTLEAELRERTKQYNYILRRKLYTLYGNKQARGKKMRKELEKQDMLRQKRGANKERNGEARS